MLFQETIRVARAAFPHGNIYLTMRDQLGTLYENEHFAALFPKRGRPAEAPWQLALVCLFQFVEGISDRQAAQAVRSRIDWKYALSLDLADPGFDYSLLSKFRTRLLASSAEMILLESMLKRFKEQGLLKALGQQRTDSTYVLAATRSLNRFECVGETLRAALNALAGIAPEWLSEHLTPEWFDRYSTRIEESRLLKGKEARKEYAEVIGADGSRLLTSLYNPSTPFHLRNCLPSKSSGEFGASSTMLRKVRCTGVKPKISLLLECALIRPTIRTHVLAINARLPGLATKSI